jgi:hypothetical protein
MRPGARSGPQAGCNHARSRFACEICRGLELRESFSTRPTRVAVARSSASDRQPIRITGVSVVLVPWLLATGPCEPDSSPSPTRRTEQPDRSDPSDRDDRDGDVDPVWSNPSPTRGARLCSRGHRSPLRPGTSAISPVLDVSAGARWPERPVVLTVMSPAAFCASASMHCAASACASSPSPSPQKS